MLIDNLAAKLNVLAVTEKDFIAGLRNNDELVFEQVFRDYYDRLCNFANTFLKDAFEAEEMVQHTFLTIWENRDCLVVHTSLKSYLYRAVHNNCLNRIKHLKVRTNHSNLLKLQAEPEFDNASQHIISNELEQQISKAIDELPQQCRTAFMLSRFENLSYAEIAEQMNISAKTVDKHIVKALKHMRGHLKEYLPVVLLILAIKYWN
jgi:RNA polymerase sigma-70 factor (ECF subfamily)